MECDFTHSSLVSYMQVLSLPLKPPLSLTPPLAYAEYILMEPSQAYQSIMATVHEKIYLSKVGRQVVGVWQV